MHIPSLPDYRARFGVGIDQAATLIVDLNVPKIGVVIENDKISPADVGSLGNADQLGR